MSVSFGFNPRAASYEQLPLGSASIPGELFKDNLSLQKEGPNIWRFLWNVDELTSVLCMLQRPTFLTLVAFVFPCVMWRTRKKRKLHLGERRCKTAVENLDGRRLGSTTIYMLMKTRNALFSPFDLIWNFVTFLWYVILPPCVILIVVSCKNSLKFLKWRVSFMNRRAEDTLWNCFLLTMGLLGKKTHLWSNGRYRQGRTQSGGCLDPGKWRNYWRCSPGFKICEHNRKSGLPPNLTFYKGLNSHL